MFTRQKNIGGPFSFILTSKLKALRSDLGSWNEHVFSVGDVSITKEIAFKKMDFYDSKERMWSYHLRRLMLEGELRRVIASRIFFGKPGGARF